MFERWPMCQPKRALECKEPAGTKAVHHCYAGSTHHTCSWPGVMQAWQKRVPFSFQSPPLLNDFPECRYVYGAASLSRTSVIGNDDVMLWCHHVTPQYLSCHKFRWSVTSWWLFASLVLMPTVPFHIWWDIWGLCLDEVAPAFAQ